MGETGDAWAAGDALADKSALAAGSARADGVAAVASQPRSNVMARRCAMARVMYGSPCEQKPLTGKVDGLEDRGCSCGKTVQAPHGDATLMIPQGCCRSTSFAPPPAGATQDHRMYP